MKIVLFGDIHANLPALQAVLSHAGQHDADAIWNAGDLIGYGAFPNDVISLLRGRKVISIIGNYDLKILKRDGAKCARGRKSGVLDQDGAMAWTYAALSEDNLSYLKLLPEQLQLTADGKKILLVHGSPESNTEYLDPRTSQNRLAEIAEISGADIIISGHAHRPMAKKCGKVWFINTGSVGRPDDGDPRACYAVLLLAGSIKVKHYRIRYDVCRAVAAIHACHLPAEFAEMVSAGRSLKHVMSRMHLRARPGKG
jgi:putative phosphoesterase